MPDWVGLELLITLRVPDWVVYDWSVYVAWGEIFTKVGGCPIYILAQASRKFPWVSLSTHMATRASSSYFAGNSNLHISIFQPEVKGWWLHTSARTLKFPKHGEYSNTLGWNDFWSFKRRAKANIPPYFRISWGKNILLGGTGLPNSGGKAWKEVLLRRSWQRLAGKRSSSSFLWNFLMDWNIFKLWHTPHKTTIEETINNQQTPLTLNAPKQATVNSGSSGFGTPFV